METNEVVKSLRKGLAQESRIVIFRLLVEECLVGLIASTIKEKLGLARCGAFSLLEEPDLGCSD